MFSKALFFRRKNHCNTPSIISHNILRMENGFRNMRHVEIVEARMHTPPVLWGRWVLTFTGSWQHKGKATWTLQGSWRPYPQKTNYHASAIPCAALDHEAGTAESSSCLQLLNPQAFCGTALPTERSGPNASEDLAPPNLPQGTVQFKLSFSFLKTPVPSLPFPGHIHTCPTP